MAQQNRGPNSTNSTEAKGDTLKRKSPDYGPDRVDTVATTQMDCETFAFLWTLKDYSTFKGLDDVKSPIFTAGSTSKHSWQLKICPQKEYQQLDYFSAYLILVEFGEGDNCSRRKIKVKFQITLLNASERPAKQHGGLSMNPCEFRKGTQSGFDKFMCCEELMSTFRRLLEDDCLRIHCRVWILGEMKHTLVAGGALTRGVSEEELDKKRKKTLSSDFGRLFRNSIMTDMIVTTSGNAFKVHKAVLAGRSQRFANLISGHGTDDFAGLTILEFEDVIVKGMLEYLYSGETEVMDERAPELLMLANQYDLLELKEDCEVHMASILNVEIAAELLVLARLQHATYLKSKVVDYILRNKEEVKKSTSFRKASRRYPNYFVDLC